MDLFRIFFDQDVAAVGLSSFREKKDDNLAEYRVNTDYKKQYFKPNYSNNFFLL